MNHPEVDAYISKLEDWQTEICNNLRKMVQQTLPKAEERLQYGKPHYLQNGHYACVIQASKAKVTFTVFNAGGLDEIKGFFEATTDLDRKTATIKKGTAPDYSQLRSFLQKAAGSS